MKALIIEDSNTTAGFLAFILQKENCESLIASTGNEAIDLLKSDNFNLVLLDLELPDMNGIGILKIIRNSFNQMQLPVIVVSGNTNEDYIFKSLDSGANDYISKPFKEIHLRLKVRNLLQSQQINRQLEDNEAKYRRLFENSQSLKMEIDADSYKVLHCNPAMASRLGTTPEKIEGEKISDFLPTKILKTREQYGLAALKNNEEVEFEDQRNGHHFFNTVTPVIEEQTRKLLIVSHDITKLKHSELDNLKFRTAIEQSSNSIVITNIEADIEFVNPAFEKLTQYTFDEVSGKNPRILKSGKQPDSFYKKMWDTISSGRSWQGEFHNKRKDESFLWEKATISPIKNTNGEIINYIAIKEDITQKKKAERELLENKERIQSIINSSPDAITFTSLTGKVLDCNNMALQIHGYSSKNEFLKLNAFDLYPPSEHAKARDNLERIVNNGGIRNTEYQLLRKDGQLFPAEISASVVKNETGEIIGITAITRDITKRVETEKQLKEYSDQLEEANTTKDKFISVLAHDLKNPFSTILGFSELLNKNIDKYDRPKIGKFAKTIHQTTQQAYMLLTNLLEWSRNQQNRVAYNPTVTNLYDIVLEACSLVSHAANNKQINIDTHIPENLEANVDIEMFKTVIRNLVGNAIKFTPEYGLIRINATNTPDKLKISVADSGVGMDSQTQKSLFKLSELKSQRGTNGEPGTGLGLMLCNEIVSKHNGKINVDSEPAKGSTFTIELPID